MSQDQDHQYIPGTQSLQDNQSGSPSASYTEHQLAVAGQNPDESFAVQVDPVELREARAAAAADTTPQTQPLNSTPKPVRTKSVEVVLHLIELRARILGGPEVMSAIDRLACPTTGKKAGERMKAAMYVLLHFAKTFEPEVQKEMMEVINKHAKDAVKLLMAKHNAQQ